MTPEEEQEKRARLAQFRDDSLIKIDAAQDPDAPPELKAEAERLKPLLARIARAGVATPNKRIGFDSIRRPDDPHLTPPSGAYKVKPRNKTLSEKLSDESLEGSGTVDDPLGFSLIQKIAEKDPYDRPLEAEGVEGEATTIADPTADEAVGLENVMAGSDPITPRRGVVGGAMLAAGGAGGLLAKALGRLFPGMGQLGRVGSAVAGGLEGAGQAAGGRAAGELVDEHLLGNKPPERAPEPPEGASEAEIQDAVLQNELVKKHEEERKSGYLLDALAGFSLGAPHGYGKYARNPRTESGQIKEALNEAGARPGVLFAEQPAVGGQLDKLNTLPEGEMGRLQLQKEYGDPIAQDVERRNKIMKADIDTAEAAVSARQNAKGAKVDTTEGIRLLDELKKANTGQVGNLNEGPLNASLAREIERYKKRLQARYVDDVGYEPPQNPFKDDALALSPMAGEGAPPLALGPIPSGGAPSGAAAGPLGLGPLRWELPPWAAAPELSAADDALMAMRGSPPGDLVPPGALEFGAKARPIDATYESPLSGEIGGVRPQRGAQATTATHGSDYRPPRSGPGAPFFEKDVPDDAAPGPTGKVDYTKNEEAFDKLLQLKKELRAEAQHGEVGTVENRPARMIEKSLRDILRGVDPEYDSAATRYHDEAGQLGELNDVLIGKNAADYVDSASRERALWSNLGALGGENPTERLLQMRKVLKQRPEYERTGKSIEAFNAAKRLGLKIKLGASDTASGANTLRDAGLVLDLRLMEPLSRAVGSATGGLQLLPLELFALRERAKRQEEMENAQTEQDRKREEEAEDPRVKAALKRLHGAR